MLWLFRKVIDRLLGRAALVVGSTLESEMEMEISETRAELLRRARKFEQEEVPGFVEIAAELRAAAGRLGKSGEVPCGSAVGAIAALAAEDLRKPASLLLEMETEASETTPAAAGLLPSPLVRKRGRPKKDQSSAADTDAVS